MPDFVGTFNGTTAAKMRELLRGSVEMLRNTSPTDYLTKYIRGKVQVEAANKRGFITVLDYRENASLAFTDPDGGSLATTMRPPHDRITCNYNYFQVGSELTNETLANSKDGRPVGADAKAEAIEKAAQRMIDVEEFYFCNGDGNQTIGRITAANAATSIPVAGTADGFGSYFLKVGQVIRIYDSTLTTLKGTRTIASKTANNAIVVDAALPVVGGDLILPEGNATSPTTSGIKGLPYIVGTDTGPYFDKNKTTTSALKPIVDGGAGVLSRTKLENIDQKHRVRNGRRGDTACVTSPAQHSQYFSLFTAGALAYYVGDKRPSADLGLDSWDYTWFGKPIRDFKAIPASDWYHLTLGSLCRVEMGDTGKMITPAGDYVQKVSANGYLNSQVRWDDAYLEFFSPNPALNAALRSLTFTGLPTLIADHYV